MQTDEAPAGYIRGGGGIVDTRRLFRVLVGSAVVALAALVVVLTIEAVHKNSRIDSLRHRGVPVDVTVTNCLGILSGTGITVTSFQCSGSFELAGRSYNAVIGGSDVNHAAGDVGESGSRPQAPDVRFDSEFARERPLVVAGFHRPRGSLLAAGAADRGRMRGGRDATQPSGLLNGEALG